MSFSMSMYRRWGVSADWSNPYRTMDPSYVAEQLRVFAQLHELGLVYRDFKPVYWFVFIFFQYFLGLQAHRQH